MSAYGPSSQTLMCLESEEGNDLLGADAQGSDLEYSKIDQTQNQSSRSQNTHLNSPSPEKNENEDPIQMFIKYIHVNHINFKETKDEKEALFAPRLEPSLNSDRDKFGDEEDVQQFLKERVTKGVYWTDREIKDLAYALQYHGFSDMKIIAKKVKTKTENDVRDYIKSCVMERRREKTKSKNKCESDRHCGRPPNSWKTVSPEILKTWPTIRKWKRLAYEQMKSCTRSKDYSRHVISALCNKFFEEEPEPEDPQVINVKLIYKYIADCMAGVIPPQLPPKESALVLDLLREVRSMHTAYDFEEERQFLKDFRNATTFKPSQEKDKFKKKPKTAPEGINDPNAVPVPDEVFLELSRHERLLQSFNPLMVPIWMVQKEQEHLEKHFEESNVHVD